MKSYCKVLQLPTLPTYQNSLALSAFTIPHIAAWPLASRSTSMWVHSGHKGGALEHPFKTYK